MINAPLSFNEADLLAELQGQGVTEVRRLQRIEKDGTITELSAVKLTFRENVPDRVYVVLESFPVRKLSDSPYKCKRCL